MPSRDDGTASAPLLGDQDEPRDVRFAISEEDAEDPRGSVQAEQEEEEDVSNKYPPPSSLPPSYREATHRRDPWYKSEVALSLHHYGRICLGGSTSFLRKYWPTSRFAQAGFFIVGLWILVIVSGPTWDKTSRLGMGNGIDDLLTALPPPPLMGDGHYLQSAVWSSPASCHPTRHGMATYCTRTTNFNLTYPRAANSFHSSDKVFIFVDPLRGHGFSDERGRAPATVEVQVDDKAPKEEAMVKVEARYEQELQALLERANVGLMSAGIRDRGVGIYTWPLPYHLRVVPQHVYPYPLLSFKIVVKLHPDAQIPNFVLDGANMDVGMFRDLPGQGKMNVVAPAKTTTGKQQRRSEEGLQMLDIGRLKTATSNLRLGHAIGKHRAEVRQALRKRADDTSSWPFFGIVRLLTGQGDILFGGRTHVMGHIWAATKAGKIDLGEEARLRGIEVHLEAEPAQPHTHGEEVAKATAMSSGGDILLGKGTQIDAKDIVSLTSRGARGIALGDDAWISATRLNADVKGAGGIASADSAEWRTNHSLVLNAPSGGIVAPVSVSPPARRELGTGTEQRAWVGVDATAGKGDVALRFKHHEAGTPVRVNAKSHERGSVEVVMQPEFGGTWHVKAPNRAGSSVTPPRTGSDGKDARGARVFESKDVQAGKDTFEASGEVWWRKKEGDKHATGEAWGSVEIEAAAGSKEAAAKLSFDG